MNTEYTVLSDKKYAGKWRIFTRQLFISSPVWLLSVMFGMTIGAPTVIIPQIRREHNSTAAVSEEMGSWLSTAVFLSGVAWVPILTIVAHFVGRKSTILLLDTCTFVVFINYYFSHNIMQLIISQSLAGMLSASLRTVTLMILTEYTSPRYRALFLAISLGSVYWGIWISNALGTFFHFKTIAFCGIAFTMYNFVLQYFIPESPTWLANRRRYYDCAVSHRWIKGTDHDSENELRVLISNQKARNDDPRTQLTVCQYLHIVREQEIYRPILCCFLISILFDWTGKLSCTVYAIDMIKKITDSERTAYTGMLILDAISVIGLYTACGLIKVMKRRTLLLSATSISIMFLYMMSIYLYLVKFAIVAENHYISLGMLVCFSFAVCCGPLIMSSVIYAEYVPMKHRSVCFIIIAVISKFAMSMYLRVAPYIFRLGIHAAFLLYGIVSTFLLFLCFKFLPETKDRTLDEIAEYFKSTKNKEQLLEK